MTSLGSVMEAVGGVPRSRPESPFRSLACERARQQVMAAVVRRVRLVLVTGRQGIGKSTFARTLVDHMGPRRTALIRAGDLVSVQHFFETVLSGFGMMSSDGSALPETTVEPHLAVARLDFLGSLALQPHAVVVVDDAERLTAEMIGALRELIEPQPNGFGMSVPQGLQLVLVGGPELPDVVRRAGLRPVGPESSARAILGTLESTEVGPYVRQRLSVANRIDVDFDDDATFRIAELSSGVPGTINKLWDQALAEARVRRPNAPERVDVKIVDAAAVALELLAAPQRPSSRWWPTVLTVLVILALVGGAGATAYVYRSEIANFLARLQ